MASPPVVIAGAGPVGLALACGLSEHGVASVVLERKPEPSPHSRAPGVLPRTLEVLRAWGLADRFLAEGTLVTHPAFWAPGAREPSVTIDLSPLADLTAAPGLLIIPQNRTEALLREHVRARGMADVRFGHEVSGFVEHEDGVSVSVASSSGPYQLGGQFLVGCDGAHSTVRRALGWPLEGKTYPTRLMLADIRLPDARNDVPWPRAALVGNVIHAALRLEPDLWRVLGTIERHVSDDEATAPASVGYRVELLFGTGPFELAWAEVFRIHCRTSPHFRRGRILLAGDAAHINSPAGGQGMNSGIQDAHNLAWKLARALDGGAREALLASYEEERRPVILGNVDRYTDLLTRSVLLAPPLLRRAALVAARSALGQPLLLRRLLRRAAMLDTRYASSLVSGRGAHLGARAPDGELSRADGGRLRLLDLVSRRAALLLFDDGRLPGWSTAAVEPLIGDVPHVSVYRLLPSARGAAQACDLVDASGTLWPRWRPLAGSAALVRPDGHVGWMQARPSAEELRAGVRRALGHP